MSLDYKFVELSTVTDEEIERTVNEWVQKGWHFETIHFAMREASKRPAMAFLQFTRPRSA
jgi:alanyl-tRNA synthetase